MAAIRDLVQALPPGAVPAAEPAPPPAGNVAWAGVRRELPRPPAGLGRAAAAFGAGPRGLLVVWHTADSTGAEDFEAQLGWLGPDRVWHRVDTAEVSGVAVSPDGRLYGYLARRVSGGKIADELVLRRTSDDGLVGRRRSGPVAPVAVTDGGVVVTQPGGPAVWAGQGEPWPLAPGTAQATGGNVVLVDAGPQSSCPGRPQTQAWLVTAGAGRMLWQGCGAADRQLLSPDGRYLVGAQAWLTPLDLQAGGRPVRAAVDTTAWSRNVSVAWEPDGGHVQLGLDLAGPDDGQGEVTVRCAVADGSCTRAP